MMISCYIFLFILASFQVQNIVYTAVQQVKSFSLLCDIWTFTVNTREQYQDSETQAAKCHSVT